MGTTAVCCTSKNSVDINQGANLDLNKDKETKEMPIKKNSSRLKQNSSRMNNNQLVADVLKDKPEKPKQEKITINEPIVHNNQEVSFKQVMIKEEMTQIKDTQMKSNSNQNNNLQAPSNGELIFQEKNHLKIKSNEPNQDQQFGTFQGQQQHLDMHFKGIRTQEINGMKSQISQHINSKLLTDSWLNSFTLVKSLNKDIFSELFLIKMKAKSELKVLRRLKKVVFKGSDQLIEDYRYTLDEWMQVEHPNIVQIYDYREDEFNFFIIQEYCSGGKLISKLEQLSEISENLIAEIMRQILSAIVYLHQKNLVYGNLNPFVLLLEKDENIQEGLNLKIINTDLQSAAIASKEGSILTPLSFCSQEYSNGSLSKGQDMWACGIFLSLLLTGQLPILSHSIDSLSVQLDFNEPQQYNFDQPIWTEVSENARAFVKRLLEYDQSKKVEAVQAMNDRWLLNMTRQRRNNQRKILNSQVLVKLKMFLAECKLIENLRKIVNQVKINIEEEKVLMKQFQTKDPQLKGDLATSQISEIYYNYSAKLIDKEHIDAMLCKMTIYVNKKGLVQYEEFIKIKNKFQIDEIKQSVRKYFKNYDEKMISDNLNNQNYKKGTLSKVAIKKLLCLIFKSNNNQNDGLISEFDKDQDSFLTIDETMHLIIRMKTY